jgi:hypothetical protein
MSQMMIQTKKRRFHPVMDQRPGSSRSVIFHPEAPQTHIYPPKEVPGRPTSSGTVIIYPDKPATIIYPARDQIRAKVKEGSKQPSGPEQVKRKRADSPELVHEQPASHTTALVVLLQRRNLAMATEFVAFYRTFKEHGIASEYWCLEDLDTAMTEYGDLIYGRAHDLDNAMRTVVLSTGDEKFYIVQPSVKEMKRGICSWLRTAVASSSKGRLQILDRDLRWWGFSPLRIPEHWGLGRGTPHHAATSYHKCGGDREILPIGK